MFTRNISKNTVFATLTVAGLFGAALLTLDVDIRVKDARVLLTAYKRGYVPLPGSNGTRQRLAHVMHSLLRLLAAKKGYRHQSQVRPG